MTVATTEAGVIRIGDGVTVEFPFSFEARFATDIRAGYIINELLEVIDPGDYTVMLNPSGIGGTVTFDVAPADEAEIYLYRETPLTQLISVSSQTKYNPKVVEEVWDKLTFIVQELTAQVNRSVKTVPGVDPDLLVEIIVNAAVSAAADAQSAADSAAAAAIWDPTNYQAKVAQLTSFVALALSANALPYATGVNTWALATLSAFARTLLDDADAPTARATLGLGTAALVAKLSTIIGQEANNTDVPSAKAVVDYHAWELLADRDPATGAADMVISLEDGYAYRVEGRELSKTDTSGQLLAFGGGSSITIPFGAAASAYFFRAELTKRSARQKIVVLDVIHGLSPGVNSWINPATRFSAVFGELNASPGTPDTGGPTSLTLAFTNYDAGAVHAYRKKLS